MNCWAKRGARAHGETWFKHPLKASDLLAKLFHVESEEIVVAESVSINIFKLGFGLLANSKDRSTILTD
jgi:kynureninase